ncbi:major facilitator superfamily domain-containing protein [Roridomyces roridus]|uniref:Major facilitator superfamily domain-containing protein n=1 Tax=Roridomyces roridus TaxID=1738132 RepID=A0AAD7FFQ2_9AGAR|nr:major facilitator superfamily domain-containing protein [Roridomyces roridus]
MSSVHSDAEKHQPKTAVGDDDDAGSSVQTLIERARAEGIKPIFLAKYVVVELVVWGDTQFAWSIRVKALNDAITECGMGRYVACFDFFPRSLTSERRYQYELFLSAGFGWFADNIWLQAIAILMPAIANQHNFPDYNSNIRMATFALYCGLIVGASFWGASCDVIGRRTAWNATLFLSGIFGVAAGASPNFVTLCAMLACIGFGVGGNLPVDGALFLEFLPGSYQYLLTLLSLWWAVGQVVASLISWVFLAKFSCDPSLVGVQVLPDGSLYRCDNTNNNGWRYSYYTMGAMMLFLAVLRVFVFPMDESPKFLLSIGRDQAAVDVIHRVAKKNGTTVKLTLQDLHDAAAPYLDPADADKDTSEVPVTKFSTWELVRNSFDDVNGENIKGLFYGAVGLAYPLFNSFLGAYLSTREKETGSTSIDATYSAYAYQAACGVAGSLLAAVMVQWSRTGRKYSLGFFTIMSGVFLFALTAAKTSTQVNALVSIASFWENAFYGVLYGYAPEVFPTPRRGTGDALAAAANRITGLFAPIIAVYSKAGQTPNGPVYASAGIFVFTGLVMFLLPIETAGVTAL